MRDMRVDEDELVRRFWERDDGDTDRWIFRGTVAVWIIVMVLLILGVIPTGGG